MNDITALALLVSKAKASVFTMEYISQFEASDIDSDDVDLRFEVDGVETGTNVSIVDECGQAAQVITALVEALEKAQAQNKMHKRAEFTFMNALGLVDGATRDDILPAINAIKYLLNNANDKISELESRTVTVKLPPRVDISNVPFTAHAWNCCLDAVEKCLAAVGIQVIEGDA